MKYQHQTLMAQLRYNTTDEEDVHKTFDILILKYRMNKEQALEAMGQNEIAVANADTWMVELQGNITVSTEWLPGMWIDRNVQYVYAGLAYIAIQAHTSQAGWEPPNVPALFNPVPVQYPGENYPRWRQPLGSEDAYKIDDRVTWETKDWKSKVNANVWEPGATGVTQWDDLTGGGGGYPAWVQPTGAQDDYDLGARVSHNGQNWESTVNANVWEPGVFGWITI